MSYFDVILPMENAWTFVDHVGHLDVMHTMDSNLNVPFASRYFSNNMLVCNSMEEKLNLIEKYILKFNKEIIYAENSENVLREIRRKVQERQEKEHKAPHTLYEEIDEYVSTKYTFIQELIKNYQ